MVRRQLGPSFRKDSKQAASLVVERPTTHCEHNGAITSAQRRRLRSARTDKFLACIKRTGIARDRFASFVASGLILSRGELISSKNLAKPNLN